MPYNTVCRISLLNILYIHYIKEFIGSSVCYVLLQEGRGVVLNYLMARWLGCLVFVSIITSSILTEGGGLFRGKETSKAPFVSREIANGKLQMYQLQMTFP